MYAYNNVIIVENVNSRIQPWRINNIPGNMYSHVHMHRAHALAMSLLGPIKLPWGH